MIASRQEEAIYLLTKSQLFMSTKRVTLEFENGKVGTVQNGKLG